MKVKEKQSIDQQGGKRGREMKERSGLGWFLLVSVLSAWMDRRFVQVRWVSGTIGLVARGSSNRAKKNREREELLMV